MTALTPTAEACREVRAYQARRIPIRSPESSLRVARICARDAQDQLRSGKPEAALSSVAQVEIILSREIDELMKVAGPRRGAER